MEALVRKKPGHLVGCVLDEHHAFIYWSHFRGNARFTKNMTFEGNFRDDSHSGSQIHITNLAGPPHLRTLGFFFG